MEQKVSSECSGVLLFRMQLTVLAHIVIQCLWQVLPQLFPPQIIWKGFLVSVAAEEIGMKAFLASVFWLTPSVFALSSIAYTFPLSPLDIHKVSGDKFVIHFLNTGVGARETIMLGCRPSLLLQHPLCPS